MKHLFITSLSILALSGCAHKSTNGDKTDVPPGYSLQDSTLNFDAAGSDSGKIEGLYSVHFEYNESTLTQSDRDLLSKDVDWLNHNPNKSFQIEGHCDRHGSNEYNLGLGQRRADSVKRYLISLGVDAKRVSTISYGKERLLDQSENEQADVKNRRANFLPIDNPALKRVSQN